MPHQSELLNEVSQLSEVNDRLIMDLTDNGSDEEIEQFITNNMNKVGKHILAHLSGRRGNSYRYFVKEYTFDVLSGAIISDRHDIVNKYMDDQLSTEQISRLVIMANQLNMLYIVPEQYRLEITS